MDFGADEFVSIFIQTFLYGAYTALFFITYWVLVYKHSPGQPIHKAILGISITMFVLATMHTVVNYIRIAKSFIILEDEPEGPAAFSNELSEFTQIFGSAIYVAQTLVSDSLLRCYIVWDQQLSIIAFPSLLLLGSTVCGMGILNSCAHVIPEAELSVVQLSQWIFSFFSMTLATNIICTSLVASRIWYINRQGIEFSAHSLRPVLFLVIESGTIYSATLFALLILYKTSSRSQYVLLDALSPIVSLVFSMIIVRIGLGLASVSGETRHMLHGDSAIGTSTDKE